MKRMGKVLNSKKTCGTTPRASKKQPLFSRPLSTLYAEELSVPQKDRVLLETGD